MARAHTSTADVLRSLLATLSEESVVSEEAGAAAHTFMLSGKDGGLQGVLLLNKETTPVFHRLFSHSLYLFIGCDSGLALLYSDLNPLLLFNFVFVYILLKPFWMAFFFLFFKGIDFF